MKPFLMALASFAFALALLATLVAAWQSRLCVGPKIPEAQMTLLMHDVCDKYSKDVGAILASAAIYQKGKIP